MKRIVTLALAATLLGGCSSGAAPGAGNVVDQVDKAKDVQNQMNDRNAELETSAP